MRISDWSSDVCSSDLCASSMFMMNTPVSWSPLVLILPLNACGPIGVDNTNFQSPSPTTAPLLTICSCGADGVGRLCTGASDCADPDVDGAGSGATAASGGGAPAQTGSAAAQGDGL